MENIASNPGIYDLPGIEKDCWYRLLNGALAGRDPLHNPAVANLCTEGVNLRTVVLRKADGIQKQLSFFTDTRSGKWWQLQQQNSISWLFYDPTPGIQIRIAGVAQLHHDDALANEAWDATTVLSRKNYLSTLLPSSESFLPLSGLPPELETGELTAAQSEAGRKNFGVVVTRVKWMDWLWLNKEGHRRASFVYDTNGGFTASWLIP